VLRLLERSRLRVGLGCPHHHDRAVRGLGEEVRAEVVTAHVGRQDDCAAGTRLQLFEMLDARELPVW
jgi:hypothetical protein